MADGIQLSTVMLCWNRLSLSQQCLASYLRTISVVNELIIVNNGSTDGTRQWLDAIKDDPRITCVIHRDDNAPVAALNEALARCRGRYLHIMENDHLYLDGWDRYVLERFRRLPDLGQLAMSQGPPVLRGAAHAGLVILSRANVGCTSVFPREVFFQHGIRFESSVRGGYYDRDGPFSMKIRQLGLLIAWSDEELAINLGHSPEEFARDPDYYIRGYRLKLFTRTRLRNQLRHLVHGRFAASRQTRLLLGRLLKLYLLKLKQQLTRRPSRT
jgi:glycosyltransferase involved in cell wall biosynthesis